MQDFVHQQYHLRWPARLIMGSNPQVAFVIGGPGSGKGQQTNLAVLGCFFFFWGGGRGGFADFAEDSVSDFFGLYFIYQQNAPSFAITCCLIIGLTGSCGLVRWSFESWNLLKLLCCGFLKDQLVVWMRRFFCYSAVWFQVTYVCISSTDWPWNHLIMVHIWQMNT